MNCFLCLFSRNNLLYRIFLEQLTVSASPVQETLACTRPEGSSPLIIKSCSRTPYWTSSISCTYLQPSIHFNISLPSVPTSHKWLVSQIPNQTFVCRLCLSYACFCVCVFILIPEWWFYHVRIMKYLENICHST
jgi:hypothetical protein